MRKGRRETHADGTRQARRAKAIIPFRGEQSGGSLEANPGRLLVAQSFGFNGRSTAFQADDEGSIPFTRSTNVINGLCDFMRARFPLRNAPG